MEPGAKKRARTSIDPEGEVEDTRSDLVILIAIKKTPIKESNTMILPADLLTTLLSSVENMKKEMTFMRHSLVTVENQNKALNNKLTLIDQDLRVLAKNAGIGFYLFPKLPQEIQRMIWNCALSFPRVIALEMKGVDRWGWDDRIFDSPELVPSTITRPLDSVSKVCRLARLAAIESQIAWFSQYPRLLEEGEVTYGNKLACHPEADVFWCVRLPDIATITKPENLRIFKFLDLMYQSGARPTSFAFALIHWVRLLRVVGGINLLMDKLRLMGIEQIVLVVGTEVHARSSEVVFVRPRETNPKEMLTSGFFQWRDSMGRDYGWDSVDRSSECVYMSRWDQVEEEAYEYLAKTQLESYEGTHQDEANKWTVRSIRFMVSYFRAEAFFFHPINSSGPYCFFRYPSSKYRFFESPTSHF
jgi:hypothetical protein